MLTDEQIDSVWDGLDGPKIINGSDCAEWNKQIRRAFARALLAAHSAEAQEPVAWRTPGMGPNSWEYVTKDPRNPVSEYELPKNAQWLHAHPQPMPQTDAARDAKRYQAIRARVRPFNAYASGNPNWAFPDYGPRGATFDEAIDAEIERLDRSKGE